MRMPRVPATCLAPLLVMAGLATGCSVNRAVPDPHPSRFLHDEAFPASAGQTIESRSEVFELGEDAKHYLDKSINRIRDPFDRDKALVDEIVLRATRNLSYEGNANTTASQTFHNLEANCLSLSILAYSMAQHLGYDATFQEVQIPEYWERRGSRTLVAGHINVLLNPLDTPGGLYFSDTIEVDFFAPGSSRRFPSRRITESRVLAMFYNNKAVDALFRGDHARAYAYLRAALREDPSLGSVHGNLAALYRLGNHLQWAAASYREAIRLDPNSTVSAEGLATVLSLMGQQKEARELLEQLHRLRDTNPYFQFVQGEEAFANADWQRAIHFFDRARELMPDADEPYFGLAKVYSALGDTDRAEAYLQRAERHADSDELKEKYRGKLSALSGR